MHLKLEKALMFTSLVLIFLACNTDDYKPVSGDLLFQVGEDSDFSEAIIQSTKRSQNYNFSHVGIVETDGSAVYVIEAVPKHGVRKVSLSQYVNSAAKSPQGKPLVLACRIRQDIDMQNSVASAQKMIGLPYDSVFAPDNQAYYCSELIYACYRDDNLHSIFSSIPMSFSDSAGNPLPYWQRYFAEMNMPIPEGKMGTNPTQLFQSEHLDIVFRFW